MTFRFTALALLHRFFASCAPKTDSRGIIQIGQLVVPEGVIGCLGVSAFDDVEAVDLNENPVSGVEGVFTLGVSYVA
jgi:hypothetical protein